MPSVLTRHVFRRMLANEPIVHRGCLRQQQRQHLSSSGTKGRQNAQTTSVAGRRHAVSRVQRRSLFDLASMFSKKREPAGASMDPGIEKMMELEKMTRLKARLPPPEEVAAALRERFKKGKEPAAAISDTQAKLIAQSLRYCLKYDNERKAEGTGETRLLTRRTLVGILHTLRLTQGRLTSSHVQLGAILYETVNQSDYAITSLSDTALLAYVRTLAFSGSALDALDVMKEYEATNPKASHSVSAQSTEQPADDVEDLEMVLPEPSETLGTVASRRATLWRALVIILEGLVLFRRYEKIDAVLAMIQDHGGLEAQSVAGIMLDYTLDRNDIDSALHWWHVERRAVLSMREVASTHNEQIQIRAAVRTRNLLQWCYLNNELDKGHQVVQELTASAPTKHEWDAIFVWAAGTKKSVDEIDRMIKVMVQANETIDDRANWRLPDIATINALVETAIARNDPYMAERFIALGRDHEINPNAYTYVLQMDYRLRVGDVDGALIAYKNLQGQDLSSNEDIPTVNRLIVALCNTQRHDFDTIMNVAADLSDRRARFEAETVATLSLLHLRRDERHDVVDLLNTHAYHYSSTDRENIRSALLDFALNENTPTALSWDTYTILRELFDEMPRTQRTELMTSFIRRERADMGVHVFQNMRMHSRADTMPTIDTYVTAFMSLAKTRDLDNLEVVHNQLKLDFNIQTSTYLLNALIIAYTACGKPRGALDYWDEIAISREGPSYNSVHVALRACEKAPFGDLKAQEIWSILRKRGVELDQGLWASYAAALAGNGDNELAFRALEEGMERGEVEIDEFLLGSLMAAGANKEKQEEIERWGRERAEGVWQGLEAKGFEVDIIGQRYPRIDRSVAP